MVGTLKDHNGLAIANYAYAPQWVANVCQEVWGNDPKELLFWLPCLAEAMQSAASELRGEDHAA